MNTPIQTNSCECPACSLIRRLEALAKLAERHGRCRCQNKDWAALIRATVRGEKLEAEA